jgi:hypothetical protein
LCERSRRTWRRFAGAIRQGIGATGANLDGGGVETERDREDVLKLGARLAAAEGFRVIARDGRDVGEVEHVRYRRYADHPDEIVIKRRVLLRHRLGVVAFDEVSNVDPDRERVYLAIPTAAIRRLSG